MKRQYSAIFCNTQSEPEIVEQIFRMRKKIFIDHYGWELPQYDDREIDAFDSLFTVHCALFQGERPVACFRAIRTDHPYLSAWVFPQLASERPYPKRPDAWEISRFGVLPDCQGDLRYSVLNYALMFHFAAQVQARHLVACAEPAHERFLQQIGIRTARYGPPSIVGTTKRGDPLVVVAGDIPIAEQSGDRFTRLCSALDNVEIINASYVLGPQRISA